MPPPCPSLYCFTLMFSDSVSDPSSVMSPLYEGATCEPQGAALGKSCTLGGFPSYSLNISTVADIQLAINFARNQNIRLVVRNTGHDFLGKNTGGGALSIWTHNHREIKVIHEYESAGGRYKGPAFKLGPGVMVYELYEAAEREGYTAVGGECRVSLKTNCAHCFHSSPRVIIGADLGMFRLLVLPVATWPVAATLP